MKLTLTKLEQETLNDIVKKEGGLWTPREESGRDYDSASTNLWARPTHGFNSRGYEQHVITKPEWFKGTGKEWSGVISSLINKVFEDAESLNDGSPHDASVLLIYSQEALEYIRETFGSLDSVFDY